MKFLRSPRVALGLGALSLTLLGSCGGGDGAEANVSGTPETSGTSNATNAGASDDLTGPGGSDEIKTVRLPMRTAGPNSLDPIKGSTVYDNRAVSLVYDTLLQYSYLKRPLQLEPQLLAKMPTPSADGLTWTFELKKGIHFVDDECFEGGKGRELVSSDVFYSWKRIANESNVPKCWWLLKDTIAGLDEYRDEQNAARDAGGTFDYDAPVEGFKIIDDHNFSVTLQEPVARFLNVIAMFQTSVVPREAVEHYGDRFERHPVGTGPYTISESDWEVNKKMTFHRSPSYRDDFYPTEWEPADEELGFHLASGKKLPFVDVVEFHMYQKDQTMWLQFNSGNLEYTQVPAENFTEAFNRRTKKVLPAVTAKGIQDHEVPLLDFIFRGFNMEDDLLGGYTEEKKKLRQAFCHAIDWVEFNTSFYNDKNIVYDGVIPPGLAGHPDGHVMEGGYTERDLERARELMAEAGYPNGEGLGPVDYYVNNSGNSPEQAEMLARHLADIGVELKPRLVTFPQLMDTVNTKKAPFFSFAWSSDYPDGENNLALFYGPNEAPGSNHFNYKSAEYDALYEKIRTMTHSDERTAIYEQMQAMLIEDAPYMGSMARTRHYLVQPWLKNYKPTEDFWNWVKYLDVDTSKQPR